MSDIADTLAPTSDQLDAVDLLGGPRTFTVARTTVRSGDEQPVNIHLEEFPRPWRPGKSMRRVLAAAWGTDSSAWVGRRVTLYCDPEVTFGRDKVGGTRISHLSHIDGPKQIPLLVSRGKSQIFTVQPLTETAQKPAVDIDSITDIDQLKGMWRAADKPTRARIEARVATLTTTTDERPAAPQPDPSVDEAWGLAENGQP